MNRLAAVARLLLAVAVALLGSVGTALAQGPIAAMPDVHFEAGWKLWALTEGKIQGSTVGDGFLAGPTFRLDLDPKWSVSTTYMDTENFGLNLDPVTTRPRNTAAEVPTRRSETDLNLQYHVIPAFTVLVDYKRIERVFNTRAGGGPGTNIQHGIGFGVAGGAALWSPTEASALHLSGAIAWLPIAWANTTSEFTANRWFNTEVGLGYTQGLGPVSLTAVLGFRWQQDTVITATTRSGGHETHEIDGYGPTLTLTARW